jgi:hypothetical protein
VTFAALGIGFGARSGAAATFAEMLQAADTAYEQRDYAKANMLYTSLLSAPELDRKMAGAIKCKRTICQINLDPTAVSKAPPATIPATQPATQPVVRQPHAKPQPGEVRDLDIKALGNFDYDPVRGGGVPDDVKQLTGLHVRMVGFMVALTQVNKITEFALVPSLTSCCYGAPPQVQHTIMVSCGAHPATYSADPVVVEGVLKVDEKREEGYTISLFEITDGSVKPLDVALSGDVLTGKKQVRPDLGSAR